MNSFAMLVILRFRTRDTNVLLSFRVSEIELSMLILKLLDVMKGKKMSLEYVSSCGTIFALLKENLQGCQVSISTLLANCPNLFVLPCTDNFKFSVFFLVVIY